LLLPPLLVSPGLRRRLRRQLPSVLLQSLLLAL
jgi:hypothetical protein